MKPSQPNPVLVKARQAAFMLSTRVDWPDPDHSDALEQLSRLMESEKAGTGNRLRESESWTNTQLRLMNTAELLAQNCFGAWWEEREKLSQQIPWLYRVASEIEQFVNQK